MIHLELPTVGPKGSKPTCLTKIMIYTDDSKINEGDIEIIIPFGKREITHIIHDIDGTHSLIRDWQPIISVLCTGQQKET